jgi:hypothetical protein
LEAVGEVREVVGRRDLAEVEEVVVVEELRLRLAVGEVVLEGVQAVRGIGVVEVAQVRCSAAAVELGF